MKKPQTAQTEKREFFGLRFLRRPHTPKPHVVAAGVRRAFSPRTQKIAAAILIGAQERTTLLNTFRHTGVRRVVAIGGSLGIPDYASLFSERLIVIRTVPIGRPLPDIPTHVAEPIPIRRIRADGRCPLEAVLGRVVIREVTLERVS